MIDVSPERTGPSHTFHRWLALAAISLAVFGSYYAFDGMGPLAPLLNSQAHFSNAQVGLLQASYSLPNIVALLIVGALIDRLGARRSMLYFGALLFVGLVVTVVTTHLGVMVAGRFLVGLGSESLAMATHVAIARWFFRSELGLAFALRTSACRLGSLVAQTSPEWAGALYVWWRWPLFLSAAFGLLTLLGVFFYARIDRHDQHVMLSEPGEQHVPFRWREILGFGRSFWLLAMLCLTFYSCIFPFQTFGQAFFIHTRHLTPAHASLLISIEPLCSLLLMPVCGYAVDRWGHRALSMLIGASLLVPVFLLLAHTSISPVVPIFLMGLAFALVPAVLWTSIVFLVKRAHIGFASALVDALQQLGLAVANLLIGVLNDRGHASATHPEGYLPAMHAFLIFALVALLSAFLLWRVERGRGASGLEAHRLARTPLPLDS